MGPGDVMALLIVVVGGAGLIIYLAKRFFSFREKQLEVDARLAAEKAAQYAVSNAELSSASGCSSNHHRPWRRNRGADRGAPATLAKSAGASRAGPEQPLEIGRGPHDITQRNGEEAQ